MNNKYLLLAFLLLNVAFASYWNAETNPMSPSDIEAQYNTELDEQIIQESGVGKAFLVTLGKPFVAIRTFFTAINNWLGEAIFVGRVVFWFSLIIVVQIVFVLFWVFLIKGIIKLLSLVNIIMNKDNIIGYAKDKFGNDLKQTKNNLHDILTLISQFI